MQICKKILQGFVYRFKIKEHSAQSGDKFKTSTSAPHKSPASEEREINFNEVKRLVVRFACMRLLSHLMRFILRRSSFSDAARHVLRGKRGVARRGLCKLYRNKRWKQLVIFDRTPLQEESLRYYDYSWLLMQIWWFSTMAARCLRAQFSSSLSLHTPLESSLTSGGGTSQKNRQIRYWRRMERVSLLCSTQSRESEGCVYLNWLQIRRIPGRLFEISLPWIGQFFFALSLFSPANSYCADHLAITNGHFVILLGTS